ncbi:MAG: hypothetical protein H0X65_19610 [Gemmatimonadetes bacterium]|nr:hypothetical protein [Gemmatimonadota bacterium]
MSRVRKRWYSSTQTESRRLKFAGESPAASSPRSAFSASYKSPVDGPRRYRIGSTSATFGDRLMYGGRIALVKRCQLQHRRVGHLCWATRALANNWHPWLRMALVESDGFGLEVSYYAIGNDARSSLRYATSGGATAC